jgi:hypothetical protein
MQIGGNGVRLPLQALAVNDYSIVLPQTAQDVCFDLLLICSV